MEQSNARDQVAVKDFERAAEMNKENPILYYNLSIGYYAVNNIEAACESFNRSKKPGLQINKVYEQTEFTKLENLCK